MSMFDSCGNLILPSGALEAYERYKMEMPGGRKTGIFVTCPRCGHRWERRSTSGGYVRCKKCLARVEVGPLRHVKEVLR